MLQPSSRRLPSCSRVIIFTLAAWAGGAAGCKGDPGATGPTGPTGTSCTVTDNGDGTATISCDDGTTVTVVGPPGTSVATVNLHLVDADSRADVIGAELTANPGELGATTDASGRATFADLPFGVYQFTVSAPGLTLAGTSVVEDAPRTVTTDPISIVAGAIVSMEFRLRRLDRETLNLITLHTGGQASYTAANCQACHNDRTNELSTDPTEPPMHALATHSSLACTTCHETVDLALHSGASISKQVSVARCTGCHPAYPVSF